jgi:two-component sensor histidine kinase/CheY-like chemotaxis protein
VAAYVAAVEGRIQALSRAHTVLAQSRWQGADLGGLVEEELAPFRTGDSSQISLQGPRVLLQPTPAQTLALALHELATNAAKYGALSCTGTVKLAWEVNAGTLSIHWTEAGGPAASKPASQGFGTRLILASVEGQLGGEAKFDWHPDGLTCTLSVPLSDKLAHPDASEHAHRVQRDMPVDVVLTGDRVMIVEDEPLVAMAMSDLMAELGLTVVGPFGRVGQAIAALKESSINAALLDINLAGELVYPLADILLADNVPFVFVTGYGSESIDRRYANVRVLQKPIKRDMLQSIFARPPVVATRSGAETAGRRRAVAR